MANVNEEDIEYEAERILAERIWRVNGRKVTYYLVKFAGYDTNESHWSTEEDVGPELLEEWDEEGLLLEDLDEADEEMGEDDDESDDESMEDEVHGEDDANFMNLPDSDALDSDGESRRRRRLPLRSRGLLDPERLSDGELSDGDEVMENVDSVLEIDEEMGEEEDNDDDDDGDAESSGLSDLDDDMFDIEMTDADAITAGDDAGEILQDADAEGDDEDVQTEREQQNAEESNTVDLDRVDFIVSERGPGVLLLNKPDPDTGKRGIPFWHPRANVTARLNEAWDETIAQALALQWPWPFNISTASPSLGLRFFTACTGADDAIVMLWPRSKGRLWLDEDKYDYRFRVPWAPTRLDLYEDGLTMDDLRIVFPLGSDGWNVTDWVARGGGQVAHRL